MGEAGEGRNITHQQKKLNEEEVEFFRQRFEIPFRRSGPNASFYRPPRIRRKWRICTSGAGSWAGTCPASVPEPDSSGAAGRLLHGLAGRLGGPRSFDHHGLCAPADAAAEAPGNRQAHCADYSGRSAHVRHGVPVPPVRNLRRQGQLYKPRDHDMFLYYKESKDGQILEEGITEAGSWRPSRRPARPTPTTAWR